MGRLEKHKWSVNGVIVTVYEESATGGSQHHRNPSIRPRNSRPRYTSGGGYDRRAELLAYTHHLRNGGSQQNSTPTSPMPKSKVKVPYSFVPDSNTYKLVNMCNLGIKFLRRKGGDCQLYCGNSDIHLVSYLEGRNGHGDMRKLRQKKMKRNVGQGGRHGVKMSKVGTCLSWNRERRTERCAE